MNLDGKKETKEWEGFKLKRIESFREETELLDFQAYGVMRALNSKQFVFGFATGLGKTYSAYSVYFYYKDKYPNTKLLILTNKSAVVQVREELFKFFNEELRVSIVHPKMEGVGGKNTYKKVRQEAYSTWAQSGDVLIMNYATFRSDIKELESSIKALKKQGYRFIFIADEATAFKNLTSQVHQAVAKVAKLADRVVALTATLTKGKLEESYAILKCLGISIVPSKEAFLERFCNCISYPNKPYIKKIVGYKEIEEFAQLIAPYALIVRKQDAKGKLPYYVLKKTLCEHSQAQIECVKNIYAGVYLKNKEQIEQEGEGGVKDELEAAEKPQDSSLTSLQGVTEVSLVLAQEGINPFKMTDSEWIALKERTQEGQPFQTVSKLTEVGFIKRALIDPRLVSREGLQDYSLKQASPKTLEIVRMLEEDFEDEKVVIYTPSKQYLYLLKHTLEKTGLPSQYKKVLEVTGDVSAVDREKNKKRFTESKTHNLMLLNDAGIESLNLQAASVMVVTSLPKSGGDLIQLAGRLSRLGSQHTELLLVYLLTEDSQDLDEYVILNEQMRLISSIMGEPEEGLLDKSSVSATGYGLGIPLIDKNSLLLRSRSNREKQYALQAWRKASED
jgi:SNF2 family DNA or RNA helicase